MAHRFRWALWIPLGILLLIILIALAVLTRPVQTALVHRIIAGVNNNIKGTLYVGSVHVIPSGIVIINDVRLTDPDGVIVLSLDTLEGRIDLWGLGKKTVRVYRVGINDLRFNIALDTSGTTNLERALASRDTTKPPPDTTKPAPWTVLLDEIRIFGGPALIYNPTDTLLNNQVWTLDADIKFKERKLEFTAEYDSPRQVHVKTEGSGVLADTLQDIKGTLSLRVDSAYTGGYYYIPANTVGRLISEMTYRQRGDSMDVDLALESSVLGSIGGNVTMMFPPGVIAGHGKVNFHHTRPAILWKDTTDLEISGDLQFSKDTSTALVNGWDVHLHVHDTRYSRYAVTQANLHIVTKDSTATIQGDLDTGSGRLGINAFVQEFVPEQMDVRADLRLTHVNLHKFISQIPDSLSPVSGQINVDGQNIASGPNRQFAVVAYLDPFSFGRYAVDTLALRAALDGNQFLVDTLTLSGYGLALDGEAEGQLKGSATYAVRADIPDLRSIEPLLSAISDTLDSLRGGVSLSLNGTAELFGKISNLTAEGDLYFSGASYGQHYVRNADVRLVQFELESMTFGVAMIADSIVIAGQQIDSLDLSASGNKEQFATDLNVWWRGDSMFVNADFTTRFEGATTIIMLDSLHALAYGVETRSEGPSVVRLNRERVELDALELRSSIGVLRANGHMQRSGDQDMAFELSGVQTEELGRILKTRIPESTTNLRVQFTGTDTSLVGDLFVTADSLMYDEVLIADQVSMKAMTTNKITTLDGLIIAHGDTAGFFGGQIPVQISFASGVVLLKDSAMSGRVKILEQRLDGFKEFMRSGTTVEGFIAGDVTFSGTPRDPRWLGNFVVRDGRYRDVRSGVDYSDIDIRGDFVYDTLRIAEFKMKSIGEMTGSGSAVMAFPLPKELALNLHLQRFQIMDNQEMRIRATGEVALSGPLDQLHAQGDLEFDEVIYRITQASMKNVEEINVDSAVAVMRGDTLAGKRGFSPTAIYRTMSHELFLRIPGNCWLRGSGMNIELAGDLWMYKDNGQQPTMTGELRTREGRVSFLGQQFQVTQGSIRFEGPIGDPQIDILAEYKPAETSTSSNPVIVHVYGTLQQTQFEFQNMSPEDAVSAFMPQGSGSGFATGAATGQLTNYLGQWAGLDVLEYRPGTGEGNNLAGGTLEVGSYVTERLFVRVKQPVETGETERVVSIEYRLIDWLKLRAQQEEQKGSALDLLFQIDWR